MRVAKPDDLDALLQFLVLEFYGRHQDRLPALNLSRATAGVRRTLRDGAVFVQEDAEGIVGSLGLLETEAAWFTDDRVLTDAWFFVLPNRRGARAATALLRVAQGAARSVGLPLAMSVGTGDHAERKDKFFRRNGFTPLGGSYLWRA